MKQIIRQSIVGMILLTMPQMMFAYNDQGDESTENTTSVTNQSTVNNVIVDQLKTTTIEQSIEHQQTPSSETKKRSASRGMSGYVGAQYVYGDKIQIFNIPLGLDVGYGFGVEANVPIVFADADVTPWNVGDEKGLGDISAGLYYHFGTPSGSGLSIVSALYKSTTGDEKKGLGSGADAYSFSYKYAKRFAGKYTLHLLGSYTLNSDYTDEFGTKTDYGDAYMGMIGGSMPCLLSDKVTTSAKLTYFHANENDTAGFKYGETDVTDLWIQWDSTQLVSGIPLGLGVKIPLQNEVKNALKDPDKTFSFYLSVAGLF